MKLEERSSEVQFGRHSKSQPSRCRDTIPRIHTRDEPIRRKHAADLARSIQSRNGRDVVVTGHEYNESSLPFRQRTNSTTSIDTIRTRPTATKFKNDTDVLVAQKSASRTHSTSSITPSSIKQSSKQKPPFQLISTQVETTPSLSLTTARVKPPRKKKIKKAGIGPAPKPLPTIFNVGELSLLSGSTTIPSSTTPTATTTTTCSAFSLDDISFSDMDTLLSIPSPPDGPMTQNNTTTTASPNANFSYSASSDAPFSTPYDEDALLENEIPFPLNKHSGVIIENMGIKKAKNLYKGRESLLNRNITTVGLDLRPHSGPTLPLTLHSLTTNQPTAAGIPSQTTTAPGISAGPSSRKDSWGCMHLGAADCELSIAFPQTSHYEVWDMDDEAFFACPVFLCLMAKDPHIWAGTPISLPDVSLINIRCDDLPVPSPMSVYDPTIEYGIQCTVPQNRGLNRGLPPPYSSSLQTAVPFVVDHKEITIEGKWERTYTKPKIQGHNNQTRIFRIADRNGDAHGMTNGRGWYLKIWIPIPARLFLKRETRIFEIRASVWMTGDGDEERHVFNLMDSEGEDDFPLVAEAEMTVSHLRRERDMMIMD